MSSIRKFWNLSTQISKETIKEDQYWNKSQSLPKFMPLVFLLGEFIDPKIVFKCNTQRKLIEMHLKYLSNSKDENFTKWLAIDFLFTC